MRRWIHSHLTFANVTSLTALFVALGGTAYAATGGNFILGKSNSASTATQLSSGAGSALRVSNTAGGHGLWASGGNHSKNTAAIHGQSGGGNAVEGYSTANPASGVFGQDNNANSYGVAGHSDNGIAVVGDSSNGWAMQALGDTTQTRTGNGFVKAMAHVNPFASNASDKIGECFNSQRPPSQATTGDCGITYTKLQAGFYQLTFGFTVDDRIASATPIAFPRALSVNNVGGDHASLTVSSYNLNNALDDAPFYIVVF
jgi:hypothetical protein